MFAALKPKKIACQKCGTKNPHLYKRCGKCNQILRTPTLEATTTKVEHSAILDRMSVMIQIQNGLELATSVLNKVPEDILSFVDKNRFMFLMVEMVTSGDQQCTDFLNLLISTGRDMEEAEEENLNAEQLDLITQGINGIRGTIDQYQEAQYPQENLTMVQQLVYRLGIYQEIPHHQHHGINYEDIEWENDEDDDWEELGDDWYEDLIQPATPGQLELVQPVNPKNVPNGEDDICPICLDQLVSEEDGELIPVSAPSCGHMFHDLCIRTWLTKVNTCPYGRCPLKTPKAILKEKINEEDIR